MKRKFKAILTVCLVVAMAVTAIVSAKQTDVYAADTSEFTDLSQSEITEAMGAGWNLGNQLESTSDGYTPKETAWGNPTVTSTLIETVKDAGFSTIRIPVSYLNMIGDANSGYEIDSDWLARVKEVVDYAIDAGLYVVINMHGDGYTTINGGWLLCGADDQETICAKYAAAWKQIATLFKDYDEHLIFESMNEVFDGTYGAPDKTSYANINTYNQIFVDTVRQTGGNNDKRWLIVCGWNTDITYTCGDYGFVIPTDNYLNSEIDGPRLMISVHYYTPWDFCGGGTQTTYSYTENGWDDPYYNIKKCWTAFVSQGYPVFIGEYGATNMNNEEDRIAFVTDVCTAAREYGCIPVIWDNGGTGTGTDKFALFNRRTYTVTQQGIIDAIMTVFEADIDGYTGDDEEKVTVYIYGGDNTGTYYNLTEIVSSSNVDMSEVAGTAYVVVTLEALADYANDIPYGTLVITDGTTTWSYGTYADVGDGQDKTALEYPTIAKEFAISISETDTFSLSAAFTGWGYDVAVATLTTVEFYDSDGNLLYTYTPTASTTSGSNGSDDDETEIGDNSSSGDDSSVGDDSSDNSDDGSSSGSSDNGNSSGSSDDGSSSDTSPKTADASPLLPIMAALAGCVVLAVIAKKRMVR